MTTIEEELDSVRQELAETRQMLKEKRIQMLTAQEYEEGEILQNFQQRYEITVGRQHSKSEELRTQLELVQNKLAEAEAKTLQRDEDINEERERNSELRCIIREKNEELETMKDEVEKAKNELAGYKTFYNQIQQAKNDLAVLIDPKEPNMNEATEDISSSKVSKLSLVRNTQDGGYTTKRTSTKSQAEPGPSQSKYAKVTATNSAGKMT